MYPLSAYVYIFRPLFQMSLRSTKSALAYELVRLLFFLFSSLHLFYFFFFWQAVSASQLVQGHAIESTQQPG